MEVNRRTKQKKGEVAQKITETDSTGHWGALPRGSFSKECKKDVRGGAQSAASAKPAETRKIQWNENRSAGEKLDAKKGYWTPTTRWLGGGGGGGGGWGGVGVVRKGLRHNRTQWAVSKKDGRRKNFRKKVDIAGRDGEVLPLEQCL